MVENTKSGYIYKTTFNNVATSKFGLDKLFPGSQVSGGILIAIALAIVIYIVHHQNDVRLRAAAPAAPTATRRATPVSTTSATSFSPWRSRARCAGAGRFPLLPCRATRSSTGPPTRRFPPRASTASPWRCSPLNNPIAVIFTGCFMSMLDIAGHAADEPDRLQRVHHRRHHRRHRVSERRSRWSSRCGSAGTEEEKTGTTRRPLNRRWNRQYRRTRPAAGVASPAAKRERRRQE